MLVTAMQDQRYDRQVRAFGSEAQQRLGELTVGVVGLGGVGSIVVQSLAHIGVRRFVLIDPDHVESSNLNRVVGATSRDVLRRRGKVGIAARMIRRVEPAAVVRAVRGDVLEDAVWSLLRPADVIVGAVDGHAPRWAVNRLAVQYARCYLDVGVSLGRCADGDRVDAGGHVAVVRPGAACLLCMAGYDPRRVAEELDPELAAAKRAGGYRVDAPAEPTPSVVFLNQILAGHVVAELLNWVMPWRPVAGYTLVDLTSGTSSVLNTERHPDCAACGPGSARGLSDAGGPPGARAQPPGGTTRT